ncbi:tRNA (N6-isopentenyl adenosine(37)-C2)-methylthiotransferase MiaB, partial [Patescibacteria group bacterium]
GFQETDDWKKVDLLVFNTCSVRQSAENRVVGQINLIQKNHPVKKGLKIVVTGCILYHDDRFLSGKFKYPVLFLSIKELSKWDQKLVRHFPRIEKRVAKKFFKISPRYNSKFQAYIPISFGCDNFCAYCVVPYARGREESRPMKEIYDEVKNLIDEGYKEITLLGQNVNSYSGQRLEGRGKRLKFSEQFPQLLELLNSIKGEFWIRFLTSHPKDLSGELIKAIASLDKVTKYLHLPVQSGDNQILKAMNRRYTVEDYKKLVAKVRKEVPGITVSTDIIVGFPGETNEQFENTVKLFKAVKFEMAYINRYSPRERTAAFSLEDNVPFKEKKRRDQKLNQVLSENIQKQNQKLIGKKIEVLVEKKKGDYWIGKDEGFRTIKFKGGKNLIGKFIDVEITRSLGWGLEGMRVEGTGHRAKVKNKLVVILGPTASGKTGWAKELVKEFRGEIISADSRQVYKGLDIGTAKDLPRGKAGKKVPQFLVDIKEPNQKFDISEYQELAYQKTEEIWKRGNLPFLVGGTGLYISAVIDGYVLPGDQPNPKLRAELESKNLDELQKELKKLDPITYQKIDFKNKRRVVRALEVWIKTGKSIVEKREMKKPSFDVLIIGIDIPREELYRKINKRVLEMIDQGLVEEVKKFYLKGYNFNHEAFSGIGYREISGDLDKLGRSEIENYQISQEVIEKIQQNTRNYAKRQMTWFRRDKRVRWVGDVDEARELIQGFINE